MPPRTSVVANVCLKIWDGRVVVDAGGRGDAGDDVVGDADAEPLPALVEEQGGSVGGSGQSARSASQPFPSELDPQLPRNTLQPRDLALPRAGQPLRTPALQLPVIQSGGTKGARVLPTRSVRGRR